MCEFNAGKCTVECKKYAMCAYFNVQKAINKIQEQLNFLQEMNIKNFEATFKVSEKSEMIQKSLESTVAVLNESINSQFSLEIEDSDSTPNNGGVCEKEDI